MHPGSRAICFLTALLAAGIELVFAALGHVEAQPVALAAAPVKEISGNAAPTVAEAAPLSARPAPVRVAAAPSAFSLSPMEARVTAYPPVSRGTVILDADSRQQASLADANERQLLFVKITQG